MNNQSERTDAEERNYQDLLKQWEKLLKGGEEDERETR